MSGFSAELPGRSFKEVMVNEELRFSNCRNLFRADRDLVLKLDLYEREGVREYWVFHPDEGLAMAFRLGRNRRYGRPETLTRSGTLESAAFPGLALPLIEIFGPAPELPLRLKTESFGDG